MFKKSKSLLISFATLSLLFVMQLLYLYIIESPTQKEQQLKNNFVKTTSLPDLAISSEAPFVRHRSLTTPFDLYRDDNGLLEYYPSTFIYKAHR